MSKLSELWHKIFGSKKEPDDVVSHPIGGRVEVQAKAIGVGVLMAPPNGQGLANAVNVRRKVSGELELEFFDRTGKAVAGGLNFSPQGLIQLRFTVGDGRLVTLTGDQVVAAMEKMEALP